MKINEIFYSIQGEGMLTGQAMVFVRVQGCNLGYKVCEFCDTDWKDGDEMTVDEIVEKVYSFDYAKSQHICFTGGEPTIKKEFGELVDRFAREDWYVSVESNGERKIKSETIAMIDALTISPKTVGFQQREGGILKVLWNIFSPEDLRQFQERTNFQEYFIQPIYNQVLLYDMADIKGVTDFILKNPKWRLSTQIHKTVGLR